ncbi:NADH-quinone oxidoreductase subunit C [Amycolatopsis mongoliensis]|uniref:NADH-quinone oxidoreductase subunit C n=1 Tax=Amycolatopsis mongoliensis TaxID=715475 RepID=A0A9Y2NCR1_9PSEU|nr:NADH-quinone oxidoreductase subunit C [Amycolatopsis sp. 4-36]WIY00946.1 NADH-quinone oxidoreductase subunit C [Amycolatopsis sp. 4-36]
MTTSPDLFSDKVGYRRSARTITPGELPERARGLLAHGYRTALIAGHDDGHQLRAVYLFTAADPDRRVELHVPLDPARPEVPSLAALSFPAGRFEREMRDLFGIVPTDHPLPRRLVRHFHWPAGWYPMLNDTGEPPDFGTQDGPYPFRTVEGDGVYEIPVGPVHAGMIEPGHFRFSVVGETILNLKARLWFVHRGIEKLFQGRRPDAALELAERISGDTAVGHTLAFCQAVEDAFAIPVPEDAQRMRAILLELERLYNHVTDLGALCNDVAHGILHTHAQRVREQLLRLNDHVTGHRLLRGAIRLGRTDLAQLPDGADLAAIGGDIAEIVQLALGNTVVADRFTGTAVLTREQAADLGALGYVARASGLSGDARYDHPFLAAEFPLAHHSRTDGDVLSRFLVRAEEIDNSIALISHLLDHLDEHTSSASALAHTSSTTARSGVGIVEGWRGTIVHRIECSADGVLTRVKVVDPSFFNWPALPVALADTIVPDFPLTNKSFNLSYAGNDL